MSRLFPFRSDTTSEAEEPKLIDISEDAADDVFSALSSGTARTAYKALHEDPRTASDLADVTDTSLQNVRYHLENLKEAGLIDVVDTWYSESGTEMKVYAPTDTSLVMFAGEDEDGSTLRYLLQEFIGGVIVLVLSSSLVQRFLADEPILLSADEPASDPSPYPTTTTEAPSSSAELLVIGNVNLLAPGIVFFAIGFLVLLGILLWRYAR